MTAAPSPVLHITKVAGLWNVPEQAQPGHYAERGVVVNTVGARGGSPVEWLVFYNRRGVLDYALRDDREGTCVNPRVLPLVVAKAAAQVWMTSPSWVPARLVPDAPQRIGAMS